MARGGMRAGKRTTRGDQWPRSISSRAAVRQTRGGREYTIVRWIARENVHTATAYHPRNGNHALRIPERAVPWNSGFLVNPGDHFDVTLSVPGVYDYFCMPHEAAGMAGRIVVGRALGPGAEPFDYWVGKPGTESWNRVPNAVRSALPSAARIVAERRVRAPGADR